MKTVKLLRVYSMRRMLMATTRPGEERKTRLILDVTSSSMLLLPSNVLWSGIFIGFAWKLQFYFLEIRDQIAGGRKDSRHKILNGYFLCYLCVRSEDRQLRAHFFLLLSFTNFCFARKSIARFSMEKPTNERRTEQKRKKNFSHYKLIIVIVYCDDSRDRKHCRRFFLDVEHGRTSKAAVDTPVGRCVVFLIHDNIISSNLSNNE